MYVESKPHYSIEANAPFLLIRADVCQDLVIKIFLFLNQIEISRIVSVSRFWLQVTYQAKVWEQIAISIAKPHIEQLPVMYYKNLVLFDHVVKKSLRKSIHNYYPCGESGQLAKARILEVNHVAFVALSLEKAIIRIKIGEEEVNYYSVPKLLLERFLKVKCIDQVPWKKLMLDLGRDIREHLHLDQFTLGYNKKAQETWNKISVRKKHEWKRNCAIKDLTDLPLTIVHEMHPKASQVIVVNFDNSRCDKETIIDQLSKIVEPEDYLILKKMRALCMLMKSIILNPIEITSVQEKLSIPSGYQLYVVDYDKNLEEKFLKMCKRITDQELKIIFKTILGTLKPAENFLIRLILPELFGNAPNLPDQSIVTCLPRSIGDTLIQ